MSRSYPHSVGARNGLVLSGVELPFVLNVLIWGAETEESRVSATAIGPAAIQVRRKLGRRTARFLSSINLDLGSCLGLTIQRLMGRQGVPFRVMKETRIPGRIAEHTVIVTRTRRLKVLPSSDLSFGGTSRLVSFLSRR